MSKYWKLLTAFVAIVAMMLSGAGTAIAQEAGTTASVLLAEDLGIVLDGNLDDWQDIPSTTTVSGPLASPDPATNGRLRWQVAADESTLYFAATITDSNIIAGEHGDEFWNEDSIELYLNFSGDLAATSYGPGVTQVRVSAADIGTGNLATLSGIDLDQVGVDGSVFATDTGWGTEIAVDVSAIAQPASGDRFGLQVHANGASTLDRDLKVIWSARDTNDTSFEDPSVFGQGVFIEGTAIATSEPETGANPPETVGAAIEEPAVVAANEITEVESIVTDPVELDSTTDPRRSLLYSAIASAIFVFGGALLLERKYRKDEEEHRRAKAAKAAAAAAEVSSVEETTDEEFQQMLSSILDDGAPTDS